MFYEKPLITDSHLTDEDCGAFRRLPGSFNAMVREIFESGRMQALKQPQSGKDDCPANLPPAEPLEALLQAVERGDLKAAQRYAQGIRENLALTKESKPKIKELSILDEATKSPF